VSGAKFASRGDFNAVESCQNRRAGDAHVIPPRRSHIQGMFRSLNDAEKVASVLVLRPIVPYSPPERERSGYEVEAPCGG